jgi:hypothetical protein
MDVQQEPLDQDPRQDLEDDSKLWTLTLKMLKEVDTQLTVNMKFLRCGGARLEYSEEADELQLKIEEDSYYDKGEFHEYVQDLIKPDKATVRKVLDKVLEKAKNS